VWLSLGIVSKLIGSWQGCLSLAGYTISQTEMMNSQGEGCVAQLEWLVLISTSFGRRDGDEGLWIHCDYQAKGHHQVKIIYMNIFIY